MDYKDLANLIFPDAKPIEFYEEKYPERDLPEGAMVVRMDLAQLVLFTLELFTKLYLQELLQIKLMECSL